MKVVNLARFAPADVKNNGDRREYAVSAYEGVKRVKHDSAAYDKNSDVNVGDRHISIKSARFSLMAGSLCEGRTEFDSIWELYESKTHSNEWCYMTVSFLAYYMGIEEFKAFVYKFGYLEKESGKNGGAIKIRCRRENAEMLQWLEARV